MNHFKLKEILMQSADVALGKQEVNGAFPSGHNGPYFDQETAVRCTAHFLFLLASVYEETGLEKYKKACFSAIDYLKSTEARPYSSTFYCRNTQGKDKCNGLVGQAWIIEALVKAAQVFDRTDCYQIAEEVFLLHPWNTGCSIWSRVEIDGNILPIDKTFNHQLWFAMSAAMLTKTPLAQERAKCFLNNIAMRVETYSDDVIFHKSQLGKLLNYRHLGFRVCLNQFKKKIIKNNMEQVYGKSVGYHGFNLYAFAMLKTLFPEEPIWDGPLINQLLSACERSKFMDTLTSSEYGYFYNFSGLEIAFSYEVFLNDSESARMWINRQFEHAGEEKSLTLTKNVADVNTALARIYIAASLKNDYEVSFFE